jgi:16S rRNA (guanine966-N2)-methyltransferase
MRVISGVLKGKTFDNQSNATHPMSEKIRGGLFNILGDIEGLTILDCYSGTGSIAFEAVSRGAMSVVSVESNKKAQKSIEANIKKLGLSKTTRLVNSTVSSFITNYPDQSFDLIICDPPFDQITDTKTIEKLENLLNEGGLLILSLPVGDQSFNFNKLKIIKEKDYGDARLVFFR